MDNLSLDSIYQDVILDHYKDPGGRKSLENADLEKTGNNPICGDRVEVSVVFDNDRISDISVNSTGCAISVASGSMLAELLPGKTISEAEELSELFRRMMHGETPPDTVDIGDLDVLEGVRQFPNRIKCVLLAWNTLKGILKEWRKNSKPVISAVQKEIH